MCRKSRENCRVENILTGGLFQIKVTQPSGRLGMVKGGEDSSQGIGMGTTQDATRTSEAMANGFSEAIVNAKTPRNEERGCLFEIFVWFHIPMFDGKRDPMELKNWLVDVEEMLQLT